VKQRVLAVLLLLAGCGYYNGYNGIYHANRFANQARKAEREGRPSEAANLWGQAEVKADSLLARQPRGKWRNDALAIRGEALAALNRCGQALGSLREAHDAATKTEVREETAIAIGRCELMLGQADVAAATLEPVVASKDAGRRTDARELRARALLQLGDYATALTELRAAGEPNTASDVMGALAGLDSVDAVQAALDDLVAEHDTLIGWDTVLSGLGRRNPAIASQMLDRLQAAGVISARRLPAFLGADAARLSGEARDRRLEQLAQLAPQSEAGDAARFELLRRRVRAAASTQELGAFVDSLAAIAAVGQTSAASAQLLVDQIGMVTRASDSVVAGSPQGDLRLFLAGEVARDSIGARAVASQLFHRVTDDWPDGPYAAKALLAARQVDPPGVEGADSLLLERYADNPYVIAARGGDRTAMKQLEDSLAAFERTLSGREGGAGAVRRGRPRPGQPADAPGAPGAKGKNQNKGKRVDEL
jgi:predicted negative regulator of RcsB-dependent stress response